MKLARLFCKALRVTFFFKLSLVFSFLIVTGFVWRLTPYTPRLVLPLNSDCDFMLFSPDGKSLVTANYHFPDRIGPLRVWDMDRGVERFAVAHQWSKIETVLFSADSKLLAAHEREGDLAVWDVFSGEERSRLRSETKYGNWVNFCFTPDSKFLVVQDYSKGWPGKDFCMVWSIADRQVRGSIESYFHWLAFATEGLAFAAFVREGQTNKGKVVLGRLDDGHPVVEREFPVVADNFAFSADLARFASSVPDSDDSAELALWDTASGIKSLSFPCDQKEWRVQQMRFVGHRVLFASGGGGQVWDISGLPRELQASAQPLAVSPDGNWAAVSVDNGAELYDLRNGGNVGHLVRFGDTGSGFGYKGIKIWPEVTFSPDNSVVAVEGLIARHRGSPVAGWLPPQIDFFLNQGLGAVTRIWDVSSGRELQALPDCSRLMFSPEGTHLASFHSGDQIIKLWSLPLRKPIGPVLGWSFLIWSPFALAMWFGTWLARRTHRHRRS